METHPPLAHLFVLQDSWDSSILTLPQGGKEEPEASVQLCMVVQSFFHPSAFHSSP